MTIAKAFDWLYAAARQDDRKAEDVLATLYHLGRGVAQDEHAAFGWYYRSAEQNDGRAEGHGGGDQVVREGAAGAAG